MRRDGSNRLYQGNVNGKEEQDHLRPQARHTPTDLYRPPMPSESSLPPPPYVVQDANGLNDLTQDHDHAG